jgi:putative redox protein
MTEHHVQADWKEGLAFDVKIGAHTITTDTVPEYGGTDSGPSPKRLLLAGLAGCTGMDVASMLGKMRMPIDSFRIDVEADQTETYPKVYDRIRIRYIFTGAELDRSKIEQAVKLSQEKYCGVSAMLEKAADISWEILLNP